MASSSEPTPICTRNEVSVVNVNGPPGNRINICMDENTPLITVTTENGAEPSLVFQGFKTYQASKKNTENEISTQSEEIANENTTIIVLAVFLAIFAVLFFTFLGLYMQKKRQ